MAESINGKLVAIIRLRGKVKLSWSIEETLKRLRLTRVNNCTVIKFDDSYKGMIKKVQNHVTYGEISNETLTALFAKHLPGVDAKEFIEGKKQVSELKESMPIRLHPAKHGLKSILKGYRQKGSLGYMGNDINGLIKRMN